MRVSLLCRGQVSLQDAGEILDIYRDIVVLLCRQAVLLR
jgi:hypothetical protein